MIGTCIHFCRPGLGCYRQAAGKPSAFYDQFLITLKSHFFEVKVGVTSTHRSITNEAVQHEQYFNVQHIAPSAQSSRKV